MAQRGHAGWLGHTPITGHQNITADQKKVACSAPCHAGEWSASSYIRGKCQTTIAAANANQVTAGGTITRPSALSSLEERNGPSMSLKINRGRPRKRGNTGCP